jgi:hypothetical protein
MPMMYAGGQVMQVAGGYGYGMQQYAGYGMQTQAYANPYGYG